MNQLLKSLIYYFLEILMKGKLDEKQSRKNENKKSKKRRELIATD